MRGLQKIKFRIFFDRELSPKFLICFVLTCFFSNISAADTMRRSAGIFQKRVQDRLSVKFTLPDDSTFNDAGPHRLVNTGTGDIYEGFSPTENLEVKWAGNQETFIGEIYFCEESSKKCLVDRFSFNLVPVKNAPENEISNESEKERSEGEAISINLQKQN